MREAIRAARQGGRSRTRRSRFRRSRSETLARRSALSALACGSVRACAALRGAGDMPQRSRGLGLRLEEGRDHRLGDRRLIDERSDERLARLLLDLEVERLLR